MRLFGAFCSESLWMDNPVNSRIKTRQAPPLTMPAGQGSECGVSRNRERPPHRNYSATSTLNCFIGLPLVVRVVPVNVTRTYSLSSMSLNFASRSAPPRNSMYSGSSESDSFCSLNRPIMLGEPSLFARIRCVALSTRNPSTVSPGFSNLKNSVSTSRNFRSFVVGFFAQSALLSVVNFVLRSGNQLPGYYRPVCRCIKFT